MTRDPDALELVRLLNDQANELSCGDWTAMDLEDNEVSHKIAATLRKAATRISSDAATGSNLPDADLLKAIIGCQGILRQEGYIYPVTIFERAVEGLVEQAAAIKRLTPPAEARREVARRLRELAQDDEDNMRFEQPARRVEIALMRRAADMLEEPHG